MTKIYVAFLTLLSLALACPPSLLSSTIQTNIMKLTSLNPTQTLYTYAFAQPFSQVPRVVIGISAINITYSSNSQSVSVFAAASSTSAQLQVKTNSEQSFWKINTITILASTNPQLFLDMVSGPLYSPTLQTFQQNVIFNLNLNFPFSNGQKIISRTYISGISSVSPLSFVILGNSTIQNNQITVYCSTKGQVTAQLWISVVAFPLESSSFSAYGGIVGANNSGTHYTDLFNSFSATQKMFYGLSKIDINWQASLPYTSMSVSIDDNFILTMSLTGQPSSFQLNYLFIGMLPEQVCQSCAARGEGQLYFYGQCVNQCPKNTVKISVGKGQMCRYCPSVMNIGYQNGQCVTCKSDTIASNGICVPLSPIFGINQINQGNNLRQSSLGISSQTTPNNPQVSATKAISTTNQQSGGTIYLPSNSVQCPMPNMYFNGFQCLCVVGYTLVSNLCVQIPPDSNYLLVPVTRDNKTISNSNNNNPSNTCTGDHQVFNGLTCVCESGYLMIDNNCTYCPINSQWNGQYCQCNQGYYLFNGACYPTGQVSFCPPNSINNGLGVCICTQSNYHLVNNSCQPISCPASKIWNGSDCVCGSNSILQANGTCSQRCSNGALWISSSQTCLAICGVNMIYDSLSQKCACIPGFAIGSGGICQQCKNGYQSINGYCVTCPTHSVFSGNQNCMCQTGFILNYDGTCSPRCSSLETFNPSNGQCECKQGLGRLDGVCTFCPSTTILIGQSCSNCPVNSLFSNGQCMCLSGYIMDTSSMTCAVCMTIPNTFMRNGYCVKCPPMQTYSAQTGQCICPSGSKPLGGKCVQSCQNDQLIDALGNCYSCPNSMVVSNGVCSCKIGYVQSTSGCGCVMPCRSNQFMFMGMCAQCPLNMIYSADIQGCICPQGYYWNNIYSVCQQGPIISVIVTCSQGQYYNNSTNTCSNCSLNCFKCTSSSCIQCQTGFILDSNGNCRTACGDGLIFGSEQCDSGATYTPGCLNCVITPGYSCTGQPSVCTYIIVPPPPTINDSLSLQGSVNINSNNIFITLKTTPTFTFSNENDMKQFIKPQFTNSYKPTVYCLQEGSPNLNLFDCLMIYPNGVPNNLFKIIFSYNYQGHSANTTISVDPVNILAAQARGRSL